MAGVVQASWAGDALWPRWRSVPMLTSVRCSLLYCSDLLARGRITTWHGARPAHSHAPCTPVHQGVAASPVVPD